MSIQLLNTANKIERALEYYINNPAGLRHVQLSAIALFHSKRRGWRRAQRLYQRAQQLLNMLRNKSIARVVHPD